MRDQHELGSFNFSQFEQEKVLQVEKSLQEQKFDEAVTDHAEGNDEAEHREDRY